MDSSTRRQSKFSRSHFLIGLTILCVGLIGDALIPELARAADIKGSGSVVVFDGGGAWGAADRGAYWEPFEAATGIKVIPNAYAPSGKVRAGIRAGSPGFDIVSLTAARLGTFVKEGLLVPIDYRFFDPADKAALSPIPAHKYAVPSFFYSNVIAYDPAKFGSSPPRVWADVWDTKRFPGPRAFPSGAWGPNGAMFEIMLLADGVPPAKLYPLDWDRAFRSLDRIRPSILKFWQSGAESVQLILDGQTVVGSTWNGRVAEILAKGGKIGMSWDQGILEFAYMVVPKGAKNVENAMKYVAFASRAKNQTRFSELVTYGPANSRAFKYMKPERAALLPTSPELLSKQIVQNANWWTMESVPLPGRTNEEAAAELWERWIVRPAKK